MRLPYSGEPFAVPPNLYIIATMNSTDRSIALVDIALRRRFAFVELKPRPELLEGRNINGLSIRKLLERLNREIRTRLGRDFEIGHSYFLDVLDGQILHLVWYYQAIPLLREYFYSKLEILKNMFHGKEELYDNSKASDVSKEELIDLLIDWVEGGKEEQVR